MSINIQSWAVGKPCLEYAAGGCVRAGGAFDRACGFPAVAACLPSPRLSSRVAMSTSRRTRRRPATEALRCTLSPLTDFPDLHGRYPQTMMLLHDSGRRPLSDTPKS